MEEQFEAVLTGTDTPIEGTVSKLNHNDFNEVYQFLSDDDTLHLVITRDEQNHWVRISGTDPYLSGWVDELAEQIQLKQTL